MQRRTFGDTDLQVSAISLGCWIFGVDWWGHRTQEDCNRMCSFALDQGITFFDNGDAYGNGRAETLFGNWMKTANVERARIEIGGKFGYDWYSDPGEAGSHRERKQDFSPQFMRRALEASLGRLQTDCLDLYLAHNIKLPQFRDDLFAELEKVKDEGKIKVWGVSLGPAIGWREEGFKAMGDHDAKAVQTVFNLFEQHPGYEFCEMARATRAGVLARVQDNSGVLKDAVKPDMQMAASDHRRFRDANWKTFGPMKVERIRHVARNHDMTIHQLACKWLLQANPSLTAITATLLDEHEIHEVCETVGKSDLTLQELKELAEGYRSDFGLPPEAHPCDLKSSVDPSGTTRSSYVPPPVYLAM
jgi:aryl-alcohol dehydrogenase-like predicted oxidoreductase